MIGISKSVYIIGNMQNPSIKSTMTQYSDQPAGFTLVEMLIATAIFVVTLVLVLDIFMIFVRDQFTEIHRKQVEDEMMYIFGTSAPQIRESFIDFDAYTTMTPSDALYLEDRNHEPTLMALGSHSAISADSDTLYVSNYTDNSPLSGDKTVIEDVQFYVYPDDDPFDVASGTYDNNQPAVVMYIKASHVEHPEIVIEYQTLITTRHYDR